MPVASGSAQTRFGIAGWGERRAGSFGGKVSTVIVYTNTKALFLFRTAEQGNGDWEFEATLTATTGKVYARLYDITGSYALANSVVSTESNSEVVLRSSEVVNLVDEHQYRVQLGVVTGDGGKLNTAALQGV